MFYEFPEITNIEQVRSAIAQYRGDSKGEYVEGIRDGFIVFDYCVMLPDSFPAIRDDENAYNYSILRECRGLIFSPEGELLRRSYHKFFNVGEREETLHANIDLSVPHVVLEKLDGSMVASYICNGKRVYGSMMGGDKFSTTLAGFVAANPQYARFDDVMAERGYTAVYEFVSPHNQIVIPYKEENLVLTALRSLRYGTYLPYSEQKALAEQYGIPCVRALPGSVDNMLAFCEETSALLGQEGWIIRFENGHMVKIKADDYVRRHKVVDTFNSEKDILAVVVSGSMDDLLPMLSTEQVDRLRSFADQVLSRLNGVADDIWGKMEEVLARVNGRKEFALAIADLPPLYRSTMFHVSSRSDISHAAVLEYLLEYAAKNCRTSTRVEEAIRPLIECRW